MKRLIQFSTAIQLRRWLRCEKKSGGRELLQKNLKRLIE